MYPTNTNNINICLSKAFLITFYYYPNLTEELQLKENTLQVAEDWRKYPIFLYPNFHSITRVASSHRYTHPSIRSGCRKVSLRSGAGRWIPPSPRFLQEVTVC